MFCSDRFIPVRKNSDWQYKFDLENYDPDELPKKCSFRSKSKALYKNLLKNELLGCNITRLEVKENNWIGKSSCDRNKLYNFSTTTTMSNKSTYLPYLKNSSYELLDSMNRSCEKFTVCKNPYKILDAPELINDFYSQLLDWSKKDNITISLGTNLYYYNCPTSSVINVGTLENEISSISWNQCGEVIAAGSVTGNVYLWKLGNDTNDFKLISKKNNKITALSWYGDNICTYGDKRGRILTKDIRAPDERQQHYFMHHTDAVCGLSWSQCGNYLSSGGNDDCVILWDQRSSKYLHKLSHKAAVKAVAWSPHKTSLLATGGGRRDSTMRFWDRNSGKIIQEFFTESQVCNLHWSINSPHIVSVHGYDTNNICIWNHKTKICIEELPAHDARILYSCMSPDNVFMACGSSEQITIYKLFPSNNNKSYKKKSLVEMFRLATK